MVEHMFRSTAQSVRSKYFRIQPLACIWTSPVLQKASCAEASCAEASLEQKWKSISLEFICFCSPTINMQHEQWQTPHHRATVRRRTPAISNLHIASRVKWFNHTMSSAFAYKCLYKPHANDVNWPFAGIEASHSPSDAERKSIDGTF